MLSFRNSGLAVLACLLLASPTATFADTPKTAPVPVSDHVDTAKLRENLAPLANTFGVKPDDQASTPSSGDDQSFNVSSDHKTMADVADRALTSIQDVTAKVADSLSKIAPQVWRIMIKQQIAKAIVAPLDSLARLGGALVLWGFGHKLWKHMEDANYEYGNAAAFNNGFRVAAIYALPLGIGVINTIDLIGSLQYSILHFVNPEFYAIQDLLNAVMHGTPPS